MKGRCLFFADSDFIIYSCIKDVFLSINNIKTDKKQEDIL